MSSGSSVYDVAIIGGGIVGLATAMQLSRRSHVSLVLVEKEDRLALHQTGHNSGVIHSGLYYEPGSLRARLCVEGREAMYRFCRGRGVPHEPCGKVVVATSESELATLRALKQRGSANGLRGLRLLGPDELKQREPHAAGLAALLVPQTGIVDFAQVSSALAESVRGAGHEVQTGARVHAVRRYADTVVLETTRGPLESRCLMNCAGLQADRVARMCGVDPRLRIIPFRGEYYALVPRRRHLVRHLVYGVPDVRFPFLGLHLTRRIGGGVQAGPNAVFAFKREGYDHWSFSPRDTLEAVCFRGFRRLLRRHWRFVAGESRRWLSRRAFHRPLQKLIPELDAADLRRSRSGVRAQAVDPSGLFVDDFRLIETDRMIHVLNAPSPAATAAIAIGRHLAGIALRRLHVE